MSSGSLQCKRYTHLLKLSLPLRDLELVLRILKLLLQALDALQPRTLPLPDIRQPVRLRLLRLQLRLDLQPPLRTKHIRLVLQTLQLDLQGDDLPVECLQSIGLALLREAQRTRGLVDEVDGLVGEVAVGDVARGVDGGGDEGGVGDLDSVVDFVAGLEAAEDGDGGLDGGLVDGDGLEAALEGSVLANGLAVLVG